jgi:fatty-acyl-CoA synthase
MPLERNVFGILDRSARASHGSRCAFTFTNGDTLTFVELRDRALDIARALLAEGIEPGDRVAVMMNNRREWVETFFGLAAAGLVCVPVNVMLMPSEIDHVLRDSGARVLVFDDLAAERAAGLQSRLDLTITVSTDIVAPAARVVAYDDLVAGADGRVVPSGPDLTDPFLLYYTSGTTGAPKATMHTHDGVLWNAMGQWNALRLDDTVKAGVIASLSWVSGFHVLVLALVWNGGSSHIRALGGATPEAIVEMLVHERITHTFLVPSLLADIVAERELVAALKESNLRWILTGSAPVPRIALQKFTDALPRIALCQGYGFSEFPAVVCVLDEAEAFERQGSTGRPMPISQVAVRGSDDVIASAGQGELLVRSLASMAGYYNRPEETARAFRDGWYHTGDLAEIDEDGFVTIIGRIKELIISGGLNVYPKEIEDVIHRVPGVHECAVVGVPNEKYGEAAAAVLVVDSMDFDVAEAEAACVADLAPYKRPSHYLLREEPLPRNANAKVLKREIGPWVTRALTVAADTGIDR